MDCTCGFEMMHCIYDRQYAEMSPRSSVLVEDIVSFGKQSEFKHQRIVFGRENVLLMTYPLKAWQKFIK